LLTGDRTIATTTRAAADVHGSWTGFAMLGRELTAGDAYRFTVAATAPGCQLQIGLTGAKAARQLLIEDPGQDVRLVSTEQSWIYERPSAWPLVSAHGRWRAFPDQAQLLAWAATRPAADADVAAFVAPSGASAPPAPSGPAPTVRSFSISDNSVRAEVAGTARSLLVVSQNLADGWTARVDGRAAPLVPVDGALMGVFVPPGTHTVTLDYRPRTFLAGAGVTGVSLLAAAVALAPRRRRGAGGRRAPDGRSPVP
jgi:hypothetical protein